MPTERGNDIISFRVPPHHSNSQELLLRVMTAIKKNIYYTVGLNTKGKDGILFYYA
jgi:hypothetical protein